jgi:outer membrane protein
MLLSPTDDTALTALPVAPSVPHPGAAARKTNAVGRRSMPQ